MRMAGGTNAKRTVHAETRDLASICGDNATRQIKQVPQCSSSINAFKTQSSFGPQALKGAHADNPDVDILLPTRYVIDWFQSDLVLTCWHHSSEVLRVDHFPKAAHFHFPRLSFDQFLKIKRYRTVPLETLPGVISWGSHSA